MKCLIENRTEGYSTIQLCTIMLVENRFDIKNEIFIIAVVKLIYVLILTVSVQIRETIN